MLYPATRASNLISHLIETVMSLVQKDNQARAKPFERVNGSNFRLIGHKLALVEVVFDALRFLQKKGSVLLRNLNELL